MQGIGDQGKGIARQPALVRLHLAKNLHQPMRFTPVAVQYRFQVVRA
jgi:hypothetical protein